MRNFLYRVDFKFVKNSWAPRVVEIEGKMTNMPELIGDVVFEDCIVLFVLCEKLNGQYQGPPGKSSLSTAKQGDNVLGSVRLSVCRGGPMPMSTFADIADADTAGKRKRKDNIEFRY